MYIQHCLITENIVEARQWTNESCNIAVGANTSWEWFKMFKRFLAHSQRMCWKSAKLANEQRNF